MTNTDLYYTPQEVAALLKFKTARPVYSSISSGELPAFEISRQFRIAREDLESWLNRSRLRLSELDPTALAKEADRKGVRIASSAKDGEENNAEKDPKKDDQEKDA